jgi:serine/threonine protein kinase
MGAVYEGVHTALGKRLAIKMIHPSFAFADTSEVVARFRREARAASAIESDYICQVFDVGKDETLGLYMVMEYLVGEDLAARITRERWIETRAAATIAWQAARGLARAHAAGVVHRDLKPANLFLTKRDDGSLLVKILDFGISKFAPKSDDPPPSEATLTAVGTALGTPQYMSPEQVEGDVAVDGRADVWALCAVLYEMLGGEPAIPEKKSNIDTLTSIVRDDVRPIAAIAPWVPAALAGVVHAGLVRDRTQRLPDAAALATRLAHAVPQAALARSGMFEVGPSTDTSQLAPLIVGSAPDTEDDEDADAIGNAEPDEVHHIEVDGPAPAIGHNPPQSAPPLETEPPPSSDAERVEVFVRPPGAVPLQLTRDLGRTEKK